MRRSRPWILAVGTKISVLANMKGVPRITARDVMEFMYYSMGLRVHGRVLDPKRIEAASENIARAGGEIGR